MSEENGKLLRNLPLFNNLTDSEIEILSKVLIKKDYPSGEILIEQNDISNSVYIIITGDVKVYRLSEDGEEINLAVLGKGEIVGELSFLDNEPRSAFVETIQKSQVLILSKDNFLHVLKDHNTIAINLLKTLSSRVRASDERLEDIMSKSLSERAWKTLRALSAHFPNKEINLSQEELAEIIGATRARVTEALNQLQTQGKIILHHKKIQVL